MKNSAILDIFNGIRGHRESMHLPKEITEAYSRVDKHHAALIEKINPKQQALFKEFVDSLESSFCDEIDFYFAEGFKLGILLGIECQRKN